MFGQFIWDIDFEDTATLSRVYIDTISNSNNVWEIGHPDKVLFISAFSNPNAIVTDSLNPYPTNDTSSFIVIHLADGGWPIGYPKVDIGGYYYVNSDSLNDYGYIDFSYDHGNTWVRVDSSLGGCTWGAVEDLPTLTGNSYGWKHFYYCLKVPYGVVNVGDTVLYRFTFVSDSVQTNKDGLMFDNLHFEDWAEGKNELHNDNLISISPNPVSEQLIIHRGKISIHGIIQIINETGNMIYCRKDYKGEAIDTQNFINGIYVLKYSDSENAVIKKFIVLH